jgi:hypothetical protein
MLAWTDTLFDLLSQTQRDLKNIACSPLLYMGVQLELFSPTDNKVNGSV